MIFGGDGARTEAGGGEDLDGFIDVGSGGDEGGQEADDVTLRAVDEQAFFEGGCDEGRTGGGELEAGHHAGSAGIGEGGEPLVQVIACLTDVWDEIFDDVEDFEGDAAGEGSAAEGGAVLAFGEGSGGGVVEEGCAEGESGGERFGGDGDVGEEVGEALVGEEVAGAAESALGFIGDEEGVGGGGEAAGFAEEGFGEEVDASFALDGLEDDGGGVFGDGGLELCDAVGGDEGDAGEEGSEGAAVVGLAGDGEGAEGASVEGVFEGHHVELSWVLARAMGEGGFEGGFHGFGAAVGEEGVGEAAPLAEAMGERGLVFVAVEVRGMEAEGGLIGNGADDAGVGVAEGIDADAGDEVEIAAAGGIGDVAAFAAVDGEGGPFVQGEQHVSMVGWDAVIRPI